MNIIKVIILFSILFSSSYIGILLAKKYENRVKELKQIKSSLNMFSTKIQLTYEPIPNIFEELSRKENINCKNVKNIFKNAYEKMTTIPAGQAWIEALDKTNTNLNKEDIEVLKGLSNLLGKVDMQGQINEIEVVENFINMQIEKAEEENKKNKKMYKTLGITAGLALVIIFI